MGPGKLALLGALLVALCVPSAAQSISAQAGKFAVDVATTPSPPVAGENKLTLTIRTAGQPASGLSVTVKVDMVGMSMPGSAQARPGGTAGVYEATVNLSMAGKWKLAVVVAQMPGMTMDGDGTAEFLVETGKGLTSAGGGGGAGRGRTVAWIVGLLVLLGAGFLLYRRLPHAARGVIVGVLTLALVAGATWAVVRKYRDPKKSTLLASAQMDMNAMQAPAGTVPVVTETVHAAEVRPSVRYVGTVVADLEQEVYPRVTGRLVSMPLYPGNKVQRGQLVARLDTTELAAKAAQAVHGETKAARGVGAAGQEVRAGAAEHTKALRAVEQSQAGVAQMRAGVRNSEAAIRATQSEMEGVRQRTVEADSMVRAASAGIDEATELVTEAQSQRESAAANVTYWRAEIERERQLLKSGAISREEYDRETAAAVAAEAELKRMGSGVGAAEARLRKAREEAAQAQARRVGAQADLRTAAAKVEQARADRDAASGRLAESEAGVRTAGAEAQATQAQVGAAAAREGIARAEQQQAGAALTEARTVLGYTEIRASGPGVVTARLIAPGVLVQPGMAIVRIAKLDYVRLQANVSEQDAHVMRPGLGVKAYLAGDPSPVAEGVLSSVFPAADPAARTTVVEARMPNPAQALRPGQSISLEIEREGEDTSGVTVPNQALTTREGETSVFVVEDQKGTPTARRVTVKTGPLAGDRTVIAKGLREGAQVVITGNDGLNDGDRVQIANQNRAVPDGGQGMSGERQGQTSPPAQGTHEGGPDTGSHSQH